MDSAYQNVSRKYSQIGFIFCLADSSDRSNLVHWHSSWAPRRPHCTEQFELMALDKASNYFQFNKGTIGELLNPKIPSVLYLDSGKLWTNLMNDTVPTIAEVGYCSHIKNRLVESACLGYGSSNPAKTV